MGIRDENELSVVGSVTLGAPTRGRDSTTTDSRKNLLILGIKDIDLLSAVGSVTLLGYIRRLPTAKGISCL